MTRLKNAIWAATDWLAANGTGIIVVIAFVGIICAVFAVKPTNSLPSVAPPTAAGPTEKTIFVSSPTIFSRERLLNDRISESQFLQKEINQSENYASEVSGAVSTEMQRILSLRVAGTDEKASSPEAGTGTPNGTASQILRPGLLTTFQDRLALRTRLAQTLAANDVDDTQIVDGVGLYRFQFVVSLLPLTDTRASARIEIGFDPPPATDDILLPIYVRMLAGAAVKANEIGADQFLAQNFARNSAATGTYANILAQQFFSPYPVRMGKTPDKDKACENAANIHKPDDDCITILLMRPASNYNDIIATLAFDGIFDRDETLRNQIKKTEWIGGIIADDIKAHSKLDPSAQPTGSEPNPNDITSIDHFLWMQSKRGSPCGSFDRNLRGETKEFVSAAVDYLSTHKIIPEELTPQNKEFLVDPRVLYMEATTVLNDEVPIVAELGSIINSTNISIAQRNAAARVEARYRDAIDSAHDNTGWLQGVQGDIGNACLRQGRDAFKRFDLPLNFTHAIAPGGRFVDKIRVLTLEPLYRSVSESFMAAGRAQVGIAVGGKPLGLDSVLSGGQASLQSNQGILLRPSVIGFMSLRSNGWLLAPDQAALDGSHGWVQAPRNELLAADVALPSWWPKVKVTIRTYWTADGNAPVSEPREEMINVALPTAGADYDALAAYSASRSNVGQNVATASILVPDGDGKEPVDGCSEETSLIIRGPNLWHSPRVFVGGQEATDVSVLPDLEGLTAKFHPAQMQSESSGLPVYVAATTGFISAGKIWINPHSACTASSQGQPSKKQSHGS